MQDDDTPADAGKPDDRLRKRAQGHLFPERFADDWQSRRVRFDCEREALLAAVCNEVLAGLGGLTIDPVVPGALRMRRFYVRTPFRRHGIGRRLATTLLERARRTGRPITVNAAPDSARFWETLGFKPDRRDGHTHILDPNEL